MYPFDTSCGDEIYGIGQLPVREVTVGNREFGYTIIFVGFFVIHWLIL